MKRNQVVLGVVAVAGLLGVQACTGGASDTSCKSDTDCKGDRVCDQGECKDPGSLGSSTSSSGGTDSSTTAATSSTATSSAPLSSSSAATSQAASSSTLVSSSSLASSAQESSSAPVSSTASSQGTSSTSNTAVASSASSGVGSGSSGAFQPGAGVFVTLSWDTTGTDLDIHLVREAPSGTFERDSDNDCNYANCKLGLSYTARWNTSDMPGEGANPVLKLDDVDGLGPEISRIQAPAPGRYKVLVHFYPGTAVGGTNATARVFLSGVQVAAPSRSITNDQWWDVGNVVWPAMGTPSFVLTDQVDGTGSSSSTMGGTSSSGMGNASSGSTGCVVGATDEFLCTGNGGHVDLEQCMCVPPSGVAGGCDFFLVSLYTLVCVNGVDVAACACGVTPEGGSSSSMGTSSSGLSSSSSRTPVCTNDCTWRQDGQCDDGGNGAATQLCALGSDCADCGAR